MHKLSSKQNLKQRDEQNDQRNIQALLVVGFLICGVAPEAEAVERAKAHVKYMDEKGVIFKRPLTHRVLS